MAVKKSRGSHISILPGKQAVGRATVALLFAIACILMLMGKTGNPAVLRLKTSLTDMLVPVLSVASRPIDAVSDAGRWVVEMSQLRDANVALKNENLQLLAWQSKAKAMEAENQALRELLKVVPEQTRGYITARVVSDWSGPYVRSVLLAGGSDQGIGKDQAVINESGLVGRVVEVGGSSARVLLLSDINSRIPVINERTHEKNILVGNNNDLPSLSYVLADSHVAEGDRIITSGDGGVFPKGIAVGVVTSVDKGTVTVQPFVDATQVEYVSVVN